MSKKRLGLNPDMMAIKNLASSGLRISRSGFRQMSQELFETRLAACIQCPHYVLASESMLYDAMKKLLSETHVCEHCGCFMRKKAKYAAEVCPEPHPDHPELSRWNEPIRNSKRGGP